MTTSLSQEHQHLMTRTQSQEHQHSQSTSPCFVIIKYGDGSQSWSLLVAFILLISKSHLCQGRLLLLCCQSFNNRFTIDMDDDQEALLNPWCSTQTFVESIRRKCLCDNGSVLDLVDLQGQVRNLSSSTEDYASDFVNGRETYVAIRVERQGENGPHRYIPLLNNLDRVHPELLVKLNNLSKPETKLNKRDRVKKAQPRPLRSNTNKADIKPRPPSAERGSRSRQGK